VGGGVCVTVTVTSSVMVAELDAAAEDVLRWRDWDDEICIVIDEEYVTDSTSVSEALWCWRRRERLFVFVRVNRKLSDTLGSRVCDRANVAERLCCSVLLCVVDGVRVPREFVGELSGEGDGEALGEADGGGDSVDVFDRRFETVSVISCDSDSLRLLDGLDVWTVIVCSQDTV
jgi:hypothetical protein